MSRYSKNVTKKGQFVSDRDGLTYYISEMMREPGTNLIISKRESDGKWNLVDHPQNHPPKWSPERIGFKNPRAEQGDFKEKYLLNDWDHSAGYNPSYFYETDVPMTTEEGSTILIEGYGADD